MDAALHLFRDDLPAAAGGSKQPPVFVDDDTGDTVLEERGPRLDADMTVTGWFESRLNKFMDNRGSKVAESNGHPGSKAYLLTPRLVINSVKVADGNDEKFIAGFSTCSTSVNQVLSVWFRAMDALSQNDSADHLLAAEAYHGGLDIIIQDQPNLQGRLHMNGAGDDNMWKLLAATRQLLIKSPLQPRQKYKSAKDHISEVVSLVLLDEKHGAFKEIRELRATDAQKPTVVAFAEKHDLDMTTALANHMWKNGRPNDEWLEDISRGSNTYLLHLVTDFAASLFLASDFPINTLDPVLTTVTVVLLNSPPKTFTMTDQSCPHVEDGRCSLVIIDAPSSMAELEGVPGWNSSTLWVPDDFERAIGQVVPQFCKKTAAPFRIAIYCSTLEDVVSRTKLLERADVTDVHVVGMSRVDLDFKERARSYVVVGTARSNQAAGRDKHRSVVDTTWYVPKIQNGSVEKRLGLSSESFAGRVRCVEEYRFLVQKYSTSGTWVHFLHSGDGVGPVAALLEGRSVLAVEAGAFVNSSTWRFDVFCQSEKLLTDQWKKAKEPGTSAVDPSTNVFDAMDRILDENPLAVSEEDKRKLEEIVSRLIDGMNAEQPDDQKLGPDQKTYLIDVALREFGNKKALDKFCAHDKYMNRMKWLMINWPHALAYIVP
jgi:hypothetical protein